MVEKINREELLKVAKNMMNYGGSFISLIGSALLHADEINQNKIKKTFSKEWRQYK